MNTDKKLYAVGGRVLNFVVTSDNFSEAKNKILLNLDKLNWQGGFYRKDIGYKVID
jgi:phosphoribosylamine--glycine ligase